MTPPVHPYAQTVRSARNQLWTDYRTDLSPFGMIGVSFDWGNFNLRKDGQLLIRAGFCCDVSVVPSEPHTITAGLVHDAGYTMCKLALCPRSWRKRWDDAFYVMLLDHGASKVQADVYWRAVRTGIGESVMRKPIKVHVAGPPRYGTKLSRRDYPPRVYEISHWAEARHLINQAPHWDPGVK